MHRSTAVRSKKTKTSSRRAKHLKGDAPIPYVPATGTRESLSDQSAGIGRAIRDRDLEAITRALVGAAPSLAVAATATAGPKFRDKISERLMNLPQRTTPDQILWLGTGLTATQAHVLAKVTPPIGTEDADGYEYLRTLRVEGRRLYEDFDLAVYLLDREEGDDEDEPPASDVVYAVVRQVGGKVTAHTLGRLNDDGELVGMYQTDLHNELRRPWEKAAAS